MSPLTNGSATPDRLHFFLILYYKWVNKCSKLCETIVANKPQVNGTQLCTLISLITVEVGIYVEGGIFWKKLVHKCNKRGVEGGKI